MKNDYIEVHIKIIQNGAVLDSDYEIQQTQYLADRGSRNITDLFKMFLDVCNSISLSEYLEEYKENAHN